MLQLPTALPWACPVSSWPLPQGGAWCWGCPCALGALLQARPRDRTCLQALVPQSQGSASPYSTFTGVIFQYQRNPILTFNFLLFFFFALVVLAVNSSVSDGLLSMTLMSLHYCSFLTCPYPGDTKWDPHQFQTDMAIKLTGNNQTLRYSCSIFRSPSFSTSQQQRSFRWS